MNQKEMDPILVAYAKRWRKSSPTMPKAKLNSEHKLPFANALAAILDDVNISANSE